MPHGFNIVQFICYLLRVSKYMYCNNVQQIQIKMGLCICQTITKKLQFIETRIFLYVMHLNLDTPPKLKRYNCP